MERESSIYVLIDPRDKVVRYVGQTVQTLASRLRLHRSSTRRAHINGNMSALYTWIHDLSKINMNPIISKIDRGVYGIDADRLEMKWIAHYRPLVKLLNNRDGGVTSPISDSQKLVLSIIGSVSPMKKSVLQYKLSGEFIRKVDGIREAGRSFGNDSWKHIGSCCLLKRKYAHGYQWRYETDNYPLIIEPIVPRIHAIQQLLNGVIVATYDDFTIASSLTGVNRKTISRCCRGLIPNAGGYQWVFKIPDQ